VQDIISEEDICMFVVLMMMVIPSYST